MLQPSTRAGRARSGQGGLKRQARLLLRQDVLQQPQLGAALLRGGVRHQRADSRQRVGQLGAAAAAAAQHEEGAQRGVRAARQPRLPLTRRAVHSAGGGTQQAQRGGVQLAAVVRGERRACRVSCVARKAQQAPDVAARLRGACAVRPHRILLRAAACCGLLPQGGCQRACQGGAAPLGQALRQAPPGARGREEKAGVGMCSGVGTEAAGQGNGLLQKPRARLQAPLT